MSLTRKIFKPGAGQTVAHYVAAFVNGTTAFVNDFMMWDPLAPASQGASGVLRGETLGANDFIFVKLCAPTHTASVCMHAGVAEGRTIGDSNTTDYFPDDSLILVQTWGVNGSVYHLDGSITADIPLVPSTTAGAVLDVAVTDVQATSATYLGSLIGFTLSTASGDYTRLASAAKSCKAFIRCAY